MNMLVFGGTRFMGKHLVHALISRGHNVTVATRGNVQDDFGDKVNRVIADRTIAESIKQNIPKVNYDILYDSLAYCSEEVKTLLDSVQCKRYIQISSASVYDDLLINTVESVFNPYEKQLIYCDREAFPYGEIKRQAECAIVQGYPQIPSVMVRFPLVIGTDDYTKRLYFYVDHIVNKKPMFIDNLNAQLAFIRSDEAGAFLAFLANISFTGAINAASEQTISIIEIIKYVESKTDKKAILSDDGEAATYNGLEDYSLNVERAKALGASFTPLLDWIYDLLDSYIIEASQQ